MIKNFIKLFHMLKFDHNWQYQQYLIHNKKYHKSDKPLSKKEFFAKKEQDKWSKVNRCC